MTWKLLGATALVLAVAGCGTDPMERTTGGAAAGAATGAGIGALGGLVGALAGAAIGGGAGAITGAATSPRDVNLGEPPWSNPEARVPGTDIGRSSRRPAAAERGRSDVQEAQRMLSQRGYDVGAVDGVMGPNTSRALSSFQRDNNLPVTGRLDGRTMQALNIEPAARAGTARARPMDERDRAYMGGGAVGTGTGAPTGPAAGGGGVGGTAPSR